MCHIQMWCLNAKKERNKVLSTAINFLHLIKDDMVTNLPKKERKKDLQQQSTEAATDKLPADTYYSE